MAWGNAGNILRALNLPSTVENAGEEPTAYTELASSTYQLKEGPPRRRPLEHRPSLECAATAAGAACLEPSPYQILYDFACPLIAGRLRDLDSGRLVALTVALTVAL